MVDAITIRVIMNYIAFNKKELKMDTSNSKKDIRLYKIDRSNRKNYNESWYSVCDFITARKM